MALVIIWGGFWTTAALLLGASLTFALFIGCASFLVPFLFFFVAAGIEEFVVAPRRRKKAAALRRKRWEKVR